MQWKTLSLVSFLGVLLANAVSCGQGLKVKIYRIDVAKGGLARKQANEVIPFDRSEGFYCASRSDFEAIVTEYKTCRDRGSP